ncbi:MAG: TspO/MBR family protein [Candidatus Gracilibacteria bacterium]|jgi:tryptophan-rich sensory protein|nr:TspO/MBR family protein [Candidatus Gracilibacteria bacterium]
MKNFKKFALILGFILLPVLGGAISGYFSLSGINDWYVSLNKPPLNPPGWIFGPVWTTLYILMGLSSYFVFSKKYLFLKKKKKFIRKMALLFYFLQLALNFLWSFMFFNLESPFLALINVAVLFVLILLTIFYSYKVKKIAGYLLIPYILWVSFASYLTLMIFLLN